MQAPQICPGYQTGEHLINIFSEDDGSLVHSLGPTEYLQGNDEDDATIAREMRSGFTYGKNYSVEVIFTTLGITQSKTEIFSKCLNLLYVKVTISFIWHCCIIIYRHTLG